MELRVVLLGWTGRRAAERADAAGLRALRAALARVEAAADADALRTADFDFFEALVALTGNRILAMLAHAVRRVYLENGALFAALYDPDRFDAALHRATVDAVATGDVESAGAAMTAYASGALAAWGPR
jgi:DNA-binding FadR family transcriptional regulator